MENFDIIEYSYSTNIWLKFESLSQMKQVLIKIIEFLRFLDI